MSILPGGWLQTGTCLNGITQIRGGGGPAFANQGGSAGGCCPYCQFCLSIVFLSHAKVSTSGQCDQGVPGDRPVCNWGLLCVPSTGVLYDPCSVNPYADHIFGCGFPGCSSSITFVLDYTAYATVGAAFPNGSGWITAYEDTDFLVYAFIRYVPVNDSRFGANPRLTQCDDYYPPNLNYAADLALPGDVECADAMVLATTGCP